MRLELRSVHAPPRAAVIHRIMQVQHLVEHHIFQRQRGARGSSKIRLITIMLCDGSKCPSRVRERTWLQPSDGRAIMPPKCFRVQLLEDLLRDRARRPAGPHVNLAPPGLPHQIDPAAAYPCGSDTAGSDAHNAVLRACGKACPSRIWASASVTGAGAPPADP